MIDGSVCNGMPLSRRFQKTAAMRGRSPIRAVSSSTIEASVTTWRTVRPSSAMRSRCGPITARKRSSIRRTSTRGASGDCGRS
jgi:hypothetical protein